MDWRSTKEVRQDEIPDTIADCEAIWHEFSRKSRIEFKETIKSLLQTKDDMNGNYRK